LKRRIVVEAPGTAPGSERLITSAVYRHSRASRQNEYRRWRVGLEGAGAFALADV